MANIKPFRAVRPKAAYAADVAALPYDVYNRAEAKKEVEQHPMSFLKIDRPETQFPEHQDMYAPEVYEQAAKTMWGMLDEGIFCEEQKECFYLYELGSEGHSQTGIVACVSIDDYLNQVIKRHENTKPEKEEDRIRHVQTCQAQTGPIFLAYRSQPELRRLIEIKKRNHPVYSFFSDDGISHKVWVIEDRLTIDKISALFQKMDSIYIADGHHRAASAIKAGLKKRKEHPDYQGTEEFNYFLCTLFSCDELKILDYNRVVKDLNGYTEAEFLQKINTCFSVEDKGTEQVRPDKKGVFGMYLGETWYRLEIKPEYTSKDAVEGLDVSILQNHLLNPVLGIRNPGADPRIDFIGGIRGLSELEKRVQEDCQVAFSLYPTSMEELMKTADEGRLMPPKSTWFEPKLRSGLFIHRI